MAKDFDGSSDLRLWAEGDNWTPAGVPASSDDVTADSANVDALFIIDSASSCRSLALTGSGIELVMSGTLTIGDASGGNFSIAAGWTTSDVSAMIFASTAGTRTITSNSVSFSFPVTINGSGGTFQLADALSTTTLTVSQGTLDLNNQNVTLSVGLVSSTISTRTITLGSGTITLNGTGTVWDCTTSTNLTINAGTGLIMIATSASARTFAGGGKTYNILQISTGAGAVTITGANTFSRIAKAGSGTQTLKFTDGTTTTLTGATPLPSGTVGNLFTLTSVSGGGWTINSTVDISCDYLNVSQLTVTGGGKLYCGLNSTDGGGNDPTTVKFTGPPAAGGAYRLGSGNLRGGQLTGGKLLGGR